MVHQYTENTNHAGALVDTILPELSNDVNFQSLPDDAKSVLAEFLLELEATSSNERSEKQSKMSAAEIIEEIRAQTEATEIEGKPEAATEAGAKAAESGKAAGRE